MGIYRQRCKPHGYYSKRLPRRVLFGVVALLIILMTHSQ